MLWRDHRQVNRGTHVDMGVPAATNDDGTQDERRGVRRASHVHFSLGSVTIITVVIAIAVAVVAIRVVVPPIPVFALLFGS